MHVHNVKHVVHTHQLNSVYSVFCHPLPCSAGRNWKKSRAPGLSFSTLALANPWLTSNSCPSWIQRMGPGHRIRTMPSLSTLPRTTVNHISSFGGITPELSRVVSLNINGYRPFFSAKVSCTFTPHSAVSGRPFPPGSLNQCKCATPPPQGWDWQTAMAWSAPHHHFPRQKDPGDNQREAQGLRCRLLGGEAKNERKILIVNMSKV